MKIDLRGTSLFFDIDGMSLVPDGKYMRQKPTIVLLHGGPGFDHSVFKPLFGEHLRDVAQILYLDVRGCGRSDRSSPEHWLLKEWAADLKELCLRLHIDRPYVFGLSFGGYVALEYAISFPTDLSGLLLASTTAKLRIDRALAVFERLGGLEARAAAELFWNDPTAESLSVYSRLCFPLYTKMPASPDITHRVLVNQELLLHYFKPGNEGRTFDLLPAAAFIRCPTLITVGTDDPITTVDDARDLAGRIPAHLVKLVEFENCGHGLHRDSPERFFSLVREFLLRSH